MRLNTLLPALVLGLFILAAPSCAVYGPPGTTVEGHVVVHNGVNLRFDSGLGLYLVVGYPDYYYYGGYYYRVYEGGRYERCRTIDGRWRTIRPTNLPPGLAMKYGVNPGEHRGRRHSRHRD